MREFKIGDRVKLDASFRNAQQGTVIAVHTMPQGWEHVEILWDAQTGFAHPDNLELCDTPSEVRQ